MMLKPTTDDLDESYARLDRPSRHGLIVGAAEQRDKRAAEGDARMAAFWSALLCYLASLEDGRRAALKDLQAAYDAPRGDDAA